MVAFADWMLDLVDTSFRLLVEVEPLIAAWPASERAVQLLASLDQLASGVDAKGEGNSADLNVRRLTHTTSFWHQTRMLMWRMTLNIMKNPAVIWLR